MESQNKSENQCHMKQGLMKQCKLQKDTNITEHVKSNQECLSIDTIETILSTLYSLKQDKLKDRSDK